jgi:CRISPR-associated endonuclease Csn1
MAQFRLGLDVGTNSLGWCALALDAEGRPTEILDIGVRIFHDSRDPKSGTSLALERRVPRGMRRRRDRYLKRRDRLMNDLVRHGLMPGDVKARKALEGLDPYELRARGLDEALTPHELGRAIFHLNQRRGFKSNRKTDAADKETGELKKAISELRRRMKESGARTLGQYLHRRLRKRKAARARPGVGIYPSRDMIEEEFDALWESQAPHHPALLTETARGDIRDTLLFQRPLRPVEPGNCELDPDDKRAPLALPLTQQFRMYQELNNLRIITFGQVERRLALAERDLIFERLRKQKTVSFNAMRTALGLDSDARFNLEDEKRKGLNGDKTGTVLKDAYGPEWYALDGAEQDAIVEAILAAEDSDALSDGLESEWNISAETALRVASVHLIDGYGRIGRKAMCAIVPIMRDQGLNYAEAAAEAGYHHSDRRPDQLSETLPYYGAALNRYTAGGTGKPEDGDEKQHGKLANPTVHVALNQLRKTANAMIARYGRPTEIVVELARDLKLGELRKANIRTEQAKNTQRNERIARELAELGQTVNGANIRRYKLWEEQGPVHERKCPYSGKIISGEMLFASEVEVEIEHILPFRRSLDDSMGNRVLSFVTANREKGNQSPYEAFGHSPRGYDYAAILARAETLPRNKAWRFAPDAMDRFEQSGDFIARQLTDTAYLARVARQYLTHICPSNNVYVIPGRLTALLRGKWGLNSLLSDANQKTRLDHRHHAVDAFIIGVTDRGMLQRVARAADDNRERVITHMPVPWDGFRDALRDRLGALTVSHKPDHGAEGRLHEETAYGLVADPAREDGFNLVYRKSFVDLNANEAGRIRDPALRQRVLDVLYEAEGVGIKPREALAAFAKETGMRRVRLLKKEAGTIPIDGPDGKPYKAYSAGDNHCIEIYALENGRWAGEALTVFQANQMGHETAWRRACIRHWDCTTARAPTRSASPPTSWNPSGLWSTLPPGGSPPMARKN